MEGSSIMRKSKKRLISKYVLFTITAVIAVLVAFPVYWLVRSSLMSDTQMFVWPLKYWPSEFRWQNYADALSRQPFFRYTLNTVTIFIFVLMGTMVTSCLAAYAFGRLDFPLKNFWFSLIIGSMIMPYAITLIPIYLGWSKLGFVNTYVPLIVPAYLGGGAFFIFLIRQFIMTLPRDLDESARIDGAGYMRILFQILLPLIKPVLAVVFIFCFLNCWNDFLGPLIYVNDPEKYTVAVGLCLFKSEYKVDWGMLMAATVIIVMPSVLIFIAGQKQLIEGITFTGMKL